MNRRKKWKARKKIRHYLKSLSLLLPYPHPLTMRIKITIQINQTAHTSLFKLSVIQPRHRNVNTPSSGHYSQAGKEKRAEPHPRIQGSRRHKGRSPRLLLSRISLWMGGTGVKDERERQRDARMVDDRKWTVVERRALKPFRCIIGGARDATSEGGGSFSN